VAGGLGCLVRHIQLSNDFNAWCSCSRHEDRKRNLERGCQPAARKKPSKLAKALEL